MTTGREPARAAATRGTLVGIAILLAVLLAGAGVALRCGAGRPRWTEAVAFAAGIAGAGALGGWLAARRPASDPAAAVAAGLGATALRIIPPLAALAWLADRGAPLRAAGGGGLLVGFYLLMLATTILLHIMVAPASAVRRPDAPR